MAAAVFMDIEICENSTLFINTYVYGKMAAAVFMDIEICENSTLFINIWPSKSKLGFI
jgi:hypothetical protein